MHAPITRSAGDAETPVLPSSAAAEGRPMSGAGIAAIVRTLAWPLGLVAVVCLGVLPSTFGPFNHDVAWYLYGSRRVMEGARLYVDIVDLNPPLVFFLGAPVEWLSLRTGATELHVMALAVALMVLASLAIAVALFRASRPGLDALGRTLIGAWLLCVLVLPGFDFGQREHWLLVLLLPYCVACLVDAEESGASPRGLGIMAGVLAGVAFSIKPYFLGALAVLWASVVLRRRTLRPLLAPPHLMVVAVGAAYLLFVLLVTPEYWRSMVPLARETYWAFGFDRLLLLQTQDVVLLIAGPVLTLVGGLLLGGASSASSRRGAILTQQMALVSLAFTAAYLVQAKGWYYQMLPAKAFGIIAAVVLVVAFVQTHRETSPAGAAAAARAPGEAVSRADHASRAAGVAGAIGEGGSRPDGAAGAVGAVGEGASCSDVAAGAVGAVGEGALGSDGAAGAAGAVGERAWRAGGAAGPAGVADVASAAGAGAGASRVPFVVRALVVGGAVVPALFFLVLNLDYHAAVYARERTGGATPLMDIVREKAAGRPLYILSSSVSPAFPMVNMAGARWPYRYHHFWPLPAFYYSAVPAMASYRPPESQSATERQFFDAIVEDVTRTPPALLLVDRSRYKQGFGQTVFEYDAYFAQDARFRALLEHYTPVGRFGTFDVFERRP